MQRERDRAACQNLRIGREGRVENLRTRNVVERMAAPDVGNEPCIRLHGKVAGRPDITHHPGRYAADPRTKLQHPVARTHEIAGNGQFLGLVTARLDLFDNAVVGDRPCRG